MGAVAMRWYWQVLASGCMHKCVQAGGVKVCMLVVHNVPGYLWTCRKQLFCERAHLRCIAGRSAVGVRDVRE